MIAAKIDAIYRYPIKGLTPEPLIEVNLAAGQTLPSDRKYAIENGPSGFDPAAPRFFPKFRFLMLAKNERLAKLSSHYDDDSHVLTIREGGKEAARGDLGTPEGRKAIEDFFSAYSADELKGPPKLLQAAGHSFSDDVEKCISIINLASVAAIEAHIGKPVNPLRFRANFYVAGWPAWHEFDLMGQEISVGGTARLKIFKRTVRCPATNVDPATGIRDLTIPQNLKEMLGHMDCGIFGKVVAGGKVTAGDPVGSI